MAEKEEEVVILEASDENFAPIEDENQEDAKSSQEAEQTQERGKAKKKLALLLVLGSVLLLIIVIILVLLFKNKNHPIEAPLEIPKVVEKQVQKEQFSPSKIENMIKKANVLYEKGDKDDALKIMRELPPLMKPSLTIT